MAEPLTSTEGRRVEGAPSPPGTLPPARSIAATSAFVLSTRLDRKNSFWRGVHAFAASGSPAMLITPPAPESSASHGPGPRASHSATSIPSPRIARASGPRRESATTVCPAAQSVRQSGAPMNPVAPVTTTFIAPFPTSPGALYHNPQGRTDPSRERVPPEGLPGPSDNR